MTNSCKLTAGIPLVIILASTVPVPLTSHAVARDYSEPLLESDVAKEPGTVIVRNALRSIARAREAILENIANANTIGYKRHLVRFIDGNSVSITRDTSPGQLIRTGRPLDIAVEGSGYFMVRDSEGGIHFTRRGDLYINRAGELVLSSGHLLSPAITVPAGVTDIRVDFDGRVSGTSSNGKGAQLGTITLSTFVNPEGLAFSGRGLFAETPASGTHTMSVPITHLVGGIRQGFLESSNVNEKEAARSLNELGEFERYLENALASVSRGPGERPEDSQAHACQACRQGILSYLNAGDVVEIRSSDYGRRRIKILTAERVRRWRRSVTSFKNALSTVDVQPASLRNPSEGNTAAVPGRASNRSTHFRGMPIYEVVEVGDEFIELRPVMPVPGHEKVDFLVMSRSSIGSVLKGTAEQIALWP